MIDDRSMCVPDNHPLRLLDLMEKRKEAIRRRLLVHDGAFRARAVIEPDEYVKK